MKIVHTDKAPAAIAIRLLHTHNIRKTGSAAIPIVLTKRLAVLAKNINQIYMAETALCKI